MLNFISPIKENYSYNNFAMKEKTPVTKINLRGNLVDKEFTNKVEEILGIILPQESCSTSIKENISCLWLGPNEWLLVSNNTITKESNDYELEQVLFESISKINLGAVTNITDHYTIFQLTGSNIFKVLSKSCPFDFSAENFKDNRVIQTVLHNTSVIIHKRNTHNSDLYVRRSFSYHLWNWLQDSSKNF